MKYSKEERMLIGKEVYEGYLGIEEAAVKYELNPYTVRDYFREYKAGVSEKPKKREGPYIGKSRKELINEIMTLRVKILLAEGKMPVEAVDELKDYFPISPLCQRAGITRAWYYKWSKQKGA